jgi:hypothetical protein
MTFETWSTGEHKFNLREQELVDVIFAMTEQIPRVEILNSDPEHLAVALAIKVRDRWIRTTQRVSEFTQRDELCLHALRDLVRDVRHALQEV